jgi:ABC-2 type transport system ATP-binding protein
MADAGTDGSPTQAGGGPFAIEVHGLEKSYGALRAVRGIDFEVQRGEVFALLGPNGAGKTTTVEILEGYLGRDAGEVRVLGLDPAAGAAELRSRVGIVLQECAIEPFLTVHEVLERRAGYYPRPKQPDDVIEMVGLAEKTKARVKSLSGGQQRRLDLGLAIVGNPELLFLDEPTTGLDPQARRNLWELVDQLRISGRTIILTTHYMDEAERLCDRVAVMDHGKVIALGTPKELIASIGGEQIVEFATGGSGQVDAAILTAMPGVQSYRVHAGMHQLSVSELHTAVPRIFASLAAQQVELTEFRTHSATLEDVFVTMTGRNLRDE